MERQDIHLGNSTCALCRQTSGDSSDVAISTTEPQYVIQKCQKGRCLICSQRPSSVVWYHKLCCDLLVSTYEIHLAPTLGDIEQLGRSIRPLYPCRNGDTQRVSCTMEEGLLSVHAKKLIEDRFGQDLLRKLPRELFVMVRDNIGMYPPLVVLGETRRLIEHRRNSIAECSIRFDLGKALYAGKIQFQGIWYISKLSNEPFPSAEPLPRSAHTTRITLSKGYMGIRNIRFSDTGFASNDGAEWYEIVEPGRLLSIVVEFNGLFVRSIQPFPMNEAREIADWDTPIPPKVRRCNMYEAIPLPRHHNRLHYMSLKTQFRGITVCCYNARNVGIFVHTGDINAYSKFARKMTSQFGHEYLFWMFFPIHDGESLSNIWIRKFSDFQGAVSNPVIALLTTRLRAFTFGPYANLGPADITYHSLLDKDDSLISGIFYDDLAFGFISKFGVTCETIEPSSGSCYLSFPVDPYAPTFISGTIGHSWYLTKASLVGVHRVQCCRDDTKTHCPFTGLLLHYDNGSSEALGQFRWDKQISILPTPFIRFCYGELGGNTYLKDICAIPPEDDEAQADGCNWEHLSGHCANWWFGKLGDKLSIEK